MKRSARSSWAGSLDLLAAGGFLQHAARVLDDRIERLILDLAGVTFLDCAGVRALAIATCFAPEGPSGPHPLPQSPSPPESSRCWALMT